MNRIVALLLCLMLVFSLSACMGEDALRGTIGTENSETETSETEEIDLSFGAVEGNVYENDFIGIGCKLDDGWSFYSDEQIKELNNITADIAGEEYMDLMEDANIIYDMYAIDSTQLNNITINLEKVNPVQLLALDIAKNFELTVGTMKSTYENMGYTNFNYEITEVTVDGKKMDAMNITAEANGYTIYQCLTAKKCNGYLANIVVSTYINNTTADLLDNFYWTR